MSASLLALLAMSSAGVGAAGPHHAFVTSTHGTADLGSWADAGGSTGIAAADSICRTRATAANLDNADQFVAWLSDSANDAYCRVSGFAGKHADKCQQVQLPVGAGPWLRVDGVPFADTVDNAVLPNRRILSALNLDEFGQPITGIVYGVFTGTAADGTLFAQGNGTCGDWTDDSDGETLQGYPEYFTSDTWTSRNPVGCNAQVRLLCMEMGDDTFAAQPTSSGGRLAFLSASTGPGNLGEWDLAGGHTGIAAGDAVCRAEAQSARLYQPDSFKAYLSDSATNAIERFGFDGPWARVDGLTFANGLAELSAGTLHRPLNVDAVGVFHGSELAFTGTTGTGVGFASRSCDDWTGAVPGGGLLGGSGKINSSHKTVWVAGHASGVCDVDNHIYCFSDADVIFHDGFRY